MSRDELLALAERVERATESEQRALLDEVGEALVRTMASYDWAVKWLGLLNAGAFLDAAMTLVPEGHNWAVESDSDGVGAWCYDKNAHNTGPQIAATPALALTAAALRAIAAMEGSQA